MSEQIKIETAEAQVPEAIEEIVFSAPAPAVPAQKFSIEEIVAWAELAPARNGINSFVLRKMKMEK